MDADQTTQLPAGRDFMSFSHDDFSTENFSLPPAATYGAFNAQDLATWSPSTSLLLSPSNATEDSFDSASSFESEMMPFSYPYLPSTNGIEANSVMPTVSDIQTSGADTSPHLVFATPHTSFSNFSPVVPFSYDEKPRQPVDSGSLNPRDMDMFPMPSDWDQTTPFTDDFKPRQNSVSVPPPSLIPSMPISPSSKPSAEPSVIGPQSTFPVPAVKEMTTSGDFSREVFSNSSLEDPNKTIRVSKHGRPILSVATDDVSNDVNSEPQQASATRNPREHEFYSRPPGPDGKYHCPYASMSQPCNHQPTTQKCSYHKYLDSHLRPYRCKFPSCLEAHFSSNACLFRHEREAHAMHGHGANPHLCHFQGCDRAAPGNGFPRRWNLHDHMKRVHNYTASDRSSSPEQSPRLAGKKKENTGGIRKRKGPSFAAAATVTSVAMKRVRSISSGSSSGASKPPVAPSVSRKQTRGTSIGQQIANAERDYDACLTRLKDELSQIHPRDAGMHEKVNATLQELHTLGIKYRLIVAGESPAGDNYIH